MKFEHCFWVFHKFNYVWREYNDSSYGTPAPSCSRIGYCKRCGKVKENNYYGVRLDYIRQASGEKLKKEDKNV